MLTPSLARAIARRAFESPFTRGGHNESRTEKHREKAPSRGPTERSGRRSSVIKFTRAPTHVQRAPDQLVTEVEHAAGVQAAIACRVARDAETGEFEGRPLARGPHLRIMRAALVQTLDLPEAKAHARRGEGDQAAGEITPDRPPSPSTACTAHRDTSPAAARRCRCPCCAHRSSRCGSRIAPRGPPAGRRCLPEPRRGRAAGVPSSPPGTPRTGRRAGASGTSKSPHARRHPI